MKKGSEHVDWMLSMGIFLVAVITIFLLLKPGIQKEHNERVLLNLLIERFERDFYWHVKVVPLFIDVCYDPEPAVPGVPIIKLDSGFWRLTNVEFWYKLVDEGKIRDITAGLSQENLRDEIACVSNIFGSGCGDVDDYSGYECYIPESSTKYGHVFYFTYTRTNPENPKTERFILEDGSSGCVLPGCKYRIGAVEDRYGLNDGVAFGYLVRKENRGEGINYGVDKIKGNWGFPENKNFFIIIKAEELNLNYETETLDEDANVFVKTLRTNLLDDKGVISPVVIYFGVW